jgi:hypothetical protein
LRQQAEGAKAVSAGVRLQSQFQRSFTAFAFG